MTRKQAILEALDVLSKIDGKSDVCDKLKEVADSVPFTHWDEKTVFDAIEQFKADNGRYPMLSEFRIKELPTHPTIKNRFKMTLKEFLKKYYPESTPQTSYKYERNREVWLKNFKQQCSRMEELRGADDYDKRRDKETPCAEILCRIIGVKNWGELCKVAGVKIIYGAPHKKLHITVNTLSDSDHDREIRRNTEGKLRTILESACILEGKEL